MRLRLCEARPRGRGQGRGVTKRDAAMAVVQVRSAVGFRVLYLAVIISSQVPDLHADLHALAM